MNHNIMAHFIVRPMPASDGLASVAESAAMEARSLERIAGCLLGGALGDAFGQPYEGQSHPDVKPFEPAAASISDDTAMSLATCEGIVAAGGRVDPAEVARAYVASFRQGLITGVGSSTLGALRALSDGTHWALAGHSGEFAAGAGAAMRVAPLAFLLDPTSSIGRTSVRDVVRITHKNDEAYAAALAVVLGVYLASQGEWDKSTLRRLSEQLPDSRTRDALDSAVQHRPTLEAFASEIGTSGFAAEAVPLALYGASLSDGFTLSSLADLVELGGDTDTIASIAGQVLGTRSGLASLPPAARALPCSASIVGAATRLSSAISASQEVTIHRQSVGLLGWIKRRLTRR